MARPVIMPWIIGSPLSHSRRTAAIIAMNLAGKGGLAKALSFSSGRVKKWLGVGMAESVEAVLKAANIGFFGAELIDCAFGRGVQ